MYDPGFTCTGSCMSAITFIDGPKAALLEFCQRSLTSWARRLQEACACHTRPLLQGVCLYRGYPVPDSLSVAVSCGVASFIVLCAGPRRLRPGIGGPKDRHRMQCPTPAEPVRPCGHTLAKTSRCPVPSHPPRLVMCVFVNESAAAALPHSVASAVAAVNQCTSVWSQACSVATEGCLLAPRRREARCRAVPAVSERDQTAHDARFR